MRFDIMTLFPELVDSILSASIIGRARQKGIIEIHSHNIRDYSTDKHHRVDDTPYGGGMGMLMSAPPIYACWQAIVDMQLASDQRLGRPAKRRVIYMSPRGSLLTQKKAYELADYDNLILLCGHYEGIDERVIEEIVDEELSIGDYVLTGGELPACVVVDCISRMIDGVLSDAECWKGESIASGLLEFPQYTRPYEFHGKLVPEVLLSGNHANIDRWRRERSLELTARQRPDLLSRDVSVVGADMSEAGAQVSAAGKSDKPTVTNELNKQFEPNHQIGPNDEVEPSDRFELSDSDESDSSAQTHTPERNVQKHLDESEQNQY